MSALNDYKLQYEELPKSRIIKKGKVTSMNKSQQAKQKPRKAVTSYNKSQTEHRKDIIIAILITAILSFIAGSII